MAVAANYSPCFARVILQTCRDSQLVADGPVHGLVFPLHHFPPLLAQVVGGGGERRVALYGWICRPVNDCLGQHERDSLVSLCNYFSASSYSVT
jgi:hypothetical protein